LPISNPANLVIFAGGEMPPLSRWMQTFAITSIAAIAATFVLHYCTQRKALGQDEIAVDVATPRLTLPAKLSGLGTARDGQPAHRMLGNAC
jgi:arsenical pump membrane protein